MKKKLILLLLFLLCAALSFGVSTLAFSKDNLANRAEQRKVSAYDSAAFSSANGMHVITLHAFDGYVNNIRLSFSRSDTLPAEVTVYYTENAEELFRAEKSVKAELEVKNSDLYLSLEKDIYSAKLVFDGGASLPSMAETNPQRLHVNVFLAILLFAAPFVILWSMTEMFFDRKEFKKDISSLRRYKYLLLDLVGRDLKTKYRRSVLGVLWSVLNPLLMMLVLTAVFSNIMRVQVEGGFALFYLTGYIMFNFVSESTNMSLSSVYYASGLIKKVYLPKYLFPLEKCIFSFVNMLFSLIAFVIVFVIFTVTGQASAHVTMLLFPIPMLYLFVFSLGLSLFLAAIYIFFRDIGHIYGVLLTVWMYASPVIYPVSILPAWLASVIKINPLYHYITYFRNIMLYGTLPSFSDNLVCLLFAFAMLGFGITIFRKAQDKFILYI